MSALFVSHGTPDDAFVRELQQALGDHGEDVWIDSRQLRGGDPLWPEIQKAIDEASAYAVVVSPASLQSKWVGKELRHALELQKQRGKEKFPVIPLSLDGTKLGAFELFFESEPIFISVSSEAGGIDSAMRAILVALGHALPADVPVTPQPKAESLEELMLELTDLKLHHESGVRRASARARLVYEPATPGQREVTSAQSWRFIAPLGPIEIKEIRWYLEQYAVWPSGVFKHRGRKVEESLVQWGQLLHQAALPIQHTANVLQAWATVDQHAGRRFSVYVDAAMEAGAPAAEQETAREAATMLLGLPWELLHDGDGFLFQGARPMRVRRRLPNTRPLDVSVMSTPVLILLVSARPEDDACAYIDHRASALPLIEAMEELGGLVRIHVLSPPTLPALREELDRARRARTPYHVVHFDGHGVYDPRVGLGGLCFEDPRDIAVLDRRRHVTVFTTELGPLLRDHRIPLVFLEACQTAQAEKASESVASELLKVGVASVVAMSHSVLVETARRFVEAFYTALAHGARVGDAMLAGQRKLKDDPFRTHVFGAGELRMEDWFVPVLFQEKGDPQLFRQVPGALAKATTREAHAVWMGELPAAPEIGFIGRSRELLGLERLLRKERYAVVRGQGGEGKTVLAAEFARWMVRSHQVRRAAFVSVETHGDHKAVLDAIGHQLVGDSYSVAAFDDMEQALQPVERALIEQATLVVVDNMESVLLPPYLDTANALSEEARHELAEVLALCARLLRSGETRLIFTSREPLPEPFAAERHRRELHQLAREDAVKLVERALNADAAGAGAAADATRQSIEALVDAVHGHARTLALLAPSLRIGGVDATRQSFAELMAEMDRAFPGSREQSPFASVELSLRRMSPVSREKARALGVFYGSVDLDVLRRMMQWEEETVIALARELIETGLATLDRYSHLTLDPALCPYLRGLLEAGERDVLQTRQGEAMRGYLELLDQLRNRNAEEAATLTLLELPNLFALLDRVHGAGNAEVTIDLATSLFRLLLNLGKPRLIARVAQVRDAAAAALGETRNNAWFEAQRTRIEQQLASGSFRDAFEGAQALLRDARAMGADAYQDADYDLAMACLLLARVSRMTGAAEQALTLTDEAQGRFEAIAKERPGFGAERMVSICDASRGDCLLALGRLDEAAAVYEKRVCRAEQLGDSRGVAVGKAQLGTVRIEQHRYKDALEAYEDARERLKQLDEPGSIAGIWHQTGMVYQQVGQPEAAENAFRRSLAINVRLGNVAGQATTLGMLGTLYDVLGRAEEAAAFFRQAAEKCIEIHDVVGEGRFRSGLAGTLRKLGRLTEARQEIRRAIEGNKQFGHAAEPWTSWGILADIEIANENPAAAAEAKRNAIAAYLGYRRDGGENHTGVGRISLSVTKQLLAGERTAAASLLQEQSDVYKAAGYGGFIESLLAIVAGDRDRSLADAPHLRTVMAAELVLLLETLDKVGR